MGTILILFISVIFLLVAMTKPRVAFYIFIFLLPFLPRYVGIGVGQEGFAMTQRRIIAGMVFVGFVANLLLQPNVLIRLRNVIQQRRVFPIMITILLIYMVKMLSTIVNSNIYNSFYVIDELLFTVIVLLMVFAFVRNHADERTIFILLVSGLFISELASVIEKIKGSPLLQGLYSVDVAIQGMDPLLGITRGDSYRCQAFFDNPLLLAQFICVILPISWYLRRDELIIIRTMAKATLFAAPLTLMFIMSRAGFIVVSLSSIIYGAYYLYKKSGMTFKFLLFALSIIIIIIAGIVVEDIFSHPYEYYNIKDAGGRSALGRIFTYKIVLDALKQSPVIGWGMTRNFTRDLNFLDNLDSYWLRILLEGGVILGILYSLLFFNIFATCVRLIKRTFDPEALSLLFALSTTLVSIFLYSFFISQPTNNVYLFLFMALLLRRNEMLQSSYKRNGTSVDAEVLGEKA